MTSLSPESTISRLYSNSQLAFHQFWFEAICSFIHRQCLLVSRLAFHPMQVRNESWQAPLWRCGVILSFLIFWTLYSFPVFGRQSGKNIFKAESGKPSPKLIWHRRSELEWTGGSAYKTFKPLLNFTLSLENVIGDVILGGSTQL